MKPLFIKSACAISAQNTFQKEQQADYRLLPNNSKSPAIHPEYKRHLSPVASRRMSPAVKMGVTAAKVAIQNSAVSNLDAIITGTGLGCIEDTEAFLNLLIDNNEEFLTPTSFIQSTHNTVAAQIALNIKCQSYNTTYVQSSNSFPSALLDAQLLLQTNQPLNVLVGGVDELGKEFVDYLKLIEPDEGGIKVPFSEGASFFILSNDNEQLSFNQLLDVECRSYMAKESIRNVIKSFLKRNKMDHSNVDLLIMGNNGDQYDDYYTAVSNEFKSSIPRLMYKKLCGEYFTAPAFSFWLADSILKNQHIPKNLYHSSIVSKDINTVLIYNHFKARDHSLILLKR